MYFSVVKKPMKMLRDPALFYDFYIKQFFMLLRIKLTGKKKLPKKIAGKKIASFEEANKMLYDGLSSDKPFFAGRIGATENRMVIYNKMIKLGARENFGKRVMIKGKNESGMFPPEEDVFRRFAEIYQDSMADMDVAVYWGHIFCEEYIIKKHYKNAKLMPSRPLEPFNFEVPWTTALKGKKVLVIHPFEYTIKKQFKNRDKLFERPDILPEFELKTLKAVQSLADEDCGFDTWMDALEYMKGEIDKLTFDIAILGCGGYAVPLASYIKRIGKKAIILGGFTQILFGIKGARWEASRPDIIAMYNEYWVRPDATEKPKGIEKTENEAYW